MSAPPLPTSAFYPVIPAGGSGTRLWPLSRAHHPKFLVDLTGSGSSLLEQTIARLSPHANTLPIVVTGRAHEEAVRASVGERARILAEPSAKNSMPAIAWAAAVAYAEDPEAVIGSFAADHLISDHERFSRVLERAQAAAELGYLVTIGIEPTYAATGFGYIQRAPQAVAHSRGLAQLGAHAVAQFVEKPDAHRAQEFIDSGEYAWNAGMFVVKARVLLEALDEQLPQLAQAARECARVCESPEDSAALEHAWSRMVSISIDHALAEPLSQRGEVAMVAADFDWDDVGDYRALAAQLRATHGPGVDTASSHVRTVQHDGNDVVLAGTAAVLPHGSRATVYSDATRPIVLIGVHDVSVVETDEVLMVLNDEHAQDLSTFVKSLEARGVGDLA